MDAELSQQILAAVRADRATVRRLVCDIPPAAEPVAGYITDIEERWRLFDELKQCYDQIGQRPPTAATFGFVMVAPLSGIRAHITAFQKMDNTYRFSWAGGVNMEAVHAMATYIPKRRTIDPNSPEAILNQPSTPTPPDQVYTSNTPWYSAQERDGGVCIFTSTSDPVAAHIYPLESSKRGDHGWIARAVRSYWGDDQASAWGRHFGDAGVVESPKNCLSMGHQLHYWFDNARFALKPLRQTPTEIVVQWHWLKRSRLLPRTELSQGRDVYVPLAGLDDMAWGSGLAHRRSGVPIQTGQTFVIRAEKPEDLPSLELLELQWNMLRVAAICGAGNVVDAAYYYDPWEDEVCNLVTLKHDEAVTSGGDEADVSSLSGQFEKTLAFRNS